MGVRYDFTQMMALKLEDEVINQGGMDPVNELTFQWTFRY